LRAVQVVGKSEITVQRESLVDSQKKRRCMRTNKGW